MNFGPRKIVISMAAMPAIRTSPRSIRSAARSAASVIAAPADQLVREVLQPDRARTFDQEDVAFAKHSVRDLDCRGRIRRPLVRRIVPRELAHADHRPDPKAASQRADLSVVPGCF